MRLVTRFLRRSRQHRAPQTPVDLIGQGIAAVAEAADTSRRGSRTRTAATVTALGVMLAVATAAYVWWKRREETSVAVLDSTPFAAGSPVTMTTPEARDTSIDASATEEERATSVAAVSVAHHAPVEPTTDQRVGDADGPLDDLEQCGDAARRAPQPTVASAQATLSRPPSSTGRFAMPGIRNVVLPGGGASLP